MWYVIEKAKKGYIGFSKQGIFFGETRMDIIKLMLNMAYDGNRRI